MGWWYVPMVLQASLIMLGWALVINNVGGRRYPSESLSCSLVRCEYPRSLSREFCLQINGSGRVDGSSFNRGLLQSEHVSIFKAGGETDSVSAFGEVTKPCLPRQEEDARMGILYFLTSRSIHREALDRNLAEWGHHPGHFASAAAAAARLFSIMCFMCVMRYSSSNVSCSDG